MSSSEEKRNEGFACRQPLLAYLPESGDLKVSDELIKRDSGNDGGSRRR